MPSGDRINDCVPKVGFSDIDVRVAGCGRGCGGGPASERIELLVARPDRHEQTCRTWSLPGNTRPARRRRARFSIKLIAFEDQPSLIDGNLIVCTTSRRLIALDPQTGKERWVFDPKEPLVGTQKCRGISHWVGSAGAGGIGVQFANLPGHRRLPSARHRCQERQALCGLRIAGDRQDGAERAGDLCWRGGGNLEARRGQRRGRRRFGRGGQSARACAEWTRAGIRCALRQAGVAVRSGAPQFERSCIQDVGAAARPVTAAAMFGRRCPWIRRWTWCTCRPTSPSGDFYGGGRPGDNRYTSGIVAVKGATGEVAWHFQFVHHNVFDYDTPSAPLLIDLPQADGTVVPALVQNNKTGLIFVFNRATGEALVPIVGAPRTASRRGSGREGCHRRSRFPDGMPVLAPRASRQTTPGVSHSSTNGYAVER